MQNARVRLLASDVWRQWGPRVTFRGGLGLVRALTDENDVQCQRNRCEWSCACSFGILWPDWPIHRKATSRMHFRMNGDWYCMSETPQGPPTLMFSIRLARN